MTANQKEMLEAIRTGKVRSWQSGDHKGRTIRSLIVAGRVGCKEQLWLKGETTYHGRRIPGSMYWGGLFVID